MRLAELPGVYAVARLGPADPVPSGFLEGAGLRSATRTADELSLVAPEAALAGVGTTEAGWTVFSVEGPLDFGLTGILAGLAGALAEAGVPLFALSTFDTDHILVRRRDAAVAVDAWRAAGHEVTTI